MGNTYGFCKVRKDKFMSGKSRFIRDSSGFWIEDDNPDYSFIVDDLDREDFLCSLVEPKNGYLDSLDPELADFLKEVYNSDDEQAMIVTRESVQGAIDVLTDLDRRVRSMPCDKNSEADVIYKRHLKPGEWKYVEDRPKDDHDDEDSVYVSSCKENVDIYKEVEKVYRYRTYHYDFPWSPDSGGASWLVDCLTKVANEMDEPSNKDYVFLLTWI